MEPDATPPREALPPELVTLREEGLALRCDRVVFDGELDFPLKLNGTAYRCAQLNSDVGHRVFKTDRLGYVSRHFCLSV